MKIVSIPEGAKDQSSGNHILITGFTVEAGASVQIVYTAKVKSDATNGAAVTNDITVTVPSTQGTTTTTSSGRVGSAFTGPGTGSAEAGRVAAAAGKAAETGGNPLTTALVVIGLALAAGITAVILRKRSLAS
jgi:hypothetical protein